MVVQHHHSGTQMPSRGVHPINAARDGFGRLARLLLRPVGPEGGAAAREDPKGRYTLIFLAAPDDEDAVAGRNAPLLELTYNWDPEGLWCRDQGGGRINPNPVRGQATRT